MSERGNTVDEYCSLLSRKIFCDFETIIDDLHERRILRKSGHMYVRINEGENYEDFLDSKQDWSHFVFAYILEEMVKEYEQDEWFLENFSYLVEKGVQEMFPKIISAAKELNIVRTIGQKVMKEYAFEFQGTYLSRLGIEQPLPDVTQSKFGMLNTLRLTRSLM